MTQILESLRPLANRAFAGISFDPEKRAESTVKEYSEMLAEDLESIKNASDEVKANYKTKFIAHLSKWLNAKSRCVSPMISGPANFPVERMRKYGNWEDKAYSDFKEYREKALKAIKRDLLANRSDEQKSEDSFLQNKKYILEAAAVIFNIDNGTDTTYNRNLFVSVIVRNVEGAAKAGDIVRVRKCLNLIQELNESKLATKPIITTNHKVWQLENMAVVAQEQKADLQTVESKSIPFNGGVIILNIKDNRLQIKHDTKPEPAVIAALKSNGFKWSPTNTAWQRFLNNGSKWAANKALNQEIFN